MRGFSARPGSAIDAERLARAASPWRCAAELPAAGSWIWPFGQVRIRRSFSVNPRLGRHRLRRRWSACTGAPGGRSIFGGPCSPTEHRLCFIQFASSRLGSPRARAARLSLRFPPTRSSPPPGQQVVEFERFDQVGVPDQAAIADFQVSERVGAILSHFCHALGRDSPVRNTAASFCMVAASQADLAVGMRALALRSPVEARERRHRPAWRVATLPA